jgi:hypothetical protein
MDREAYEEAKDNAAWFAKGGKTVNNYDMQDYMHSPTDVKIEADSAGAFYKAGADAERARIVGLFDAEEEQISEQDWTNNSMKRLDAHQRIIEGLREKK